MATLDLDTLFPKRVLLIDACYKAGGMCMAVDDGYTCTLPKNHKGDTHIAHSSLAEPVHTWPRTQSECCHVEVRENRFCPKCGYECRLIEV